MVDPFLCIDCIIYNTPMEGRAVEHEFLKFSAYFCTWSLSNAPSTEGHKEVVIDKRVNMSCRLDLLETLFKQTCYCEERSLTLRCSTDIQSSALSELECNATTQVGVRGREIPAVSGYANRPDNKSRKLLSFMREVISPKQHPLQPFHLSNQSLVSPRQCGR